MSGTDDILLETTSATEYNAISPQELDEIRKNIALLIEHGKPIAELGIEKYAPPIGMPFEFVHSTPKLPDIAKDDRTLWYRCSYCETDRKFMEGRIVICADKKLRLIGLTCWKHHVSEQAWITAGESWKDYERRKKITILKERYVPAIDTFLSSLSMALKNSSQTISFTDNFRRSFERQFSVLVKLLRQAANGDRGLYINREIRLPFGKRETRREPVHFLVGSKALFDSEEIVHTQITDAVNFMQSAHDSYHQIEWQSLSDKDFNKHVDKFFTQCKKAIALTKDAMARMKQVQSFLSYDNVYGINAWINNKETEFPVSEYSGTYTALPAGIKYTPYNGTTVAIALPESFSTPQMQGLETLERLLEISGLRQ